MNSLVAILHCYFRVGCGLDLMLSCIIWLDVGLCIVLYIWLLYIVLYTYVTRHVLCCVVPILWGESLNWIYLGFKDD